MTHEHHDHAHDAHHCDGHVDEHAEHDHAHEHHHCDEHVDGHDEHDHGGEGGRVRAWIDIVTILVVAVFLAFSFLTGRVRSFLASYYVWLCPVTVLPLVGMCVARLRAHRRGYTPCQHGHASWELPIPACAAIILTAVVTALAVNPRRYSPEGLRKRRAMTRARDAELEKAIRWVLGEKISPSRTQETGVSLPKKPTILDLLNAVEEGHRELVQGQYVTVLGQCDLTGGPEGERFDLYRLVVTCCIADATAVFVEVVRVPNVKLESGGWVRVGGIVRFDSGIDPSLPVIHATTMSKIPEPSEPYL